MKFQTCSKALALVAICLFAISAARAQTYIMGTAPATNGATINNVTSGTFYDPGGLGGNYSDNQNLTVTFCAPAGQQLVADFSQVAMEPGGWDYLEVYDAPTTSLSARIIRLTVGAPEKIVSTTGCLTFKFSSDAGPSTFAGWVAAFSAITVPTYALNATNQNTTINTCLAVITDDGGEPGNYSSNQDRHFTICSGTSDPLNITFLKNTTAPGDYIYVYDGTSTSAPLIGTMTNNNNIRSFASSGTCLTIRFVTQGNSWDGWKALVQCMGPIASTVVIPIPGGKWFAKSEHNLTL